MNARNGTFRSRQADHLSGINGYPSVFSVAHGQIVDMHLALKPGTSTTSLVRCEFVDAVSGIVVARDSSANGMELRPQSPQTYCGEGAGYSFVFPLPTTGLEPGLYECRVVAATGETSSGIYFNIRPGEESIGKYDALVILPTFTWQAYNDIGGGSFYTGHAHPPHSVSLKRPISAEGMHSPKGAIPLLKVLREERLRTACIDSLDLHRRKVNLAGVPVVVLVGHDEYWSARMRRQIDSYIRGGGSVVVFGGNTCWWKISVKGSEISVLKGKRVDEKNKKGKVSRGRRDQWFRPHIADPEEATFGSSYRFGGYALERVAKSPRSQLKSLVEGLSQTEIDAARAITVTRKDHPVFSGVVLPKNGRFGGDIPIVHGEIDAVRLDGAGNVDRTICPAVPIGTRVLATGRVASGLIQPTGALKVGIVVESRIGSGLVLNFGSFGWWLGLHQNNPAIKRILINAINYCRLPPSQRPLQPRRSLPRRILEKVRRLLHI